jgi:hypothetical protein
MRLSRILALAVLFLLLGVGQSQAQLLFSLSPNTQTGNPGTEVFFSGTLTNNGASNLFLNNLSFSFIGPNTGLYLSGDTNVFFSNVPGILTPSQTYTGQIFGINIDPTTPFGTYTGTVKVLGGTDRTTLATIGSSTFRVTVSPAPTGLLTVGLTTACGLCFGWYNRRKRVFLTRAQ